MNREEILKLVKVYAKENLSNINLKPFTENDKVFYAGKIFNEEEVVALVDSCLDFWLTQGRFYDEFEEALTKYLNVKYASFVNSGSSANLLAFMSLTSPLIEKINGNKRKINVGDEVITVACGFPTTIAPIVQAGAVPVFVDMDIPTYNANVDQIENAITDRTRAIFLAHTLGNPFDIARIKKICDKYNLWLIEDTCDAFDSEIEMDGKIYKAGTIGDVSTSSFYPAHHMTTGEGGAVYTNDGVIHKIVQSMRDWGRDCICKSGVDNTCKHRYDGTYGELPKGYDHKYVYSHFGYNLKATDMQAAIGIKQLLKVPTFTKMRRENFNYMKELMINRGLDKYFIMPEATKNTNPSWFAFIISCRDGISREKVVRYLENKNIQTRMLFAGNIIKQPAFDSIRNDKTKYRVAAELVNTDYIMNNTFLLGVYPGIDKTRIEYIVNNLENAVKV